MFRRCAPPPMMMAASARRLLVRVPVPVPVPNSNAITTAATAATRYHGGQGQTFTPIPRFRGIATTIPRASPPPPPPPPHVLTQHSTSTSTTNDVHPTTTPTPTPFRPLKSLPTTALLRSILLHTISGVPALLTLSTTLLSREIPGIDRAWHPLFWLLYPTFYTHFCAGRTEAEIARAGNQLRELGISGLIMSYAREVDGDASSSSPSSSSSSSPSTTTTGPSIAETEKQHLDKWIQGTMQTIRYSRAGDFTAVKFSGGGAAIMRLLRACKPPSPEIETALNEMCVLARERGVGILVDAEHARDQDGIDLWTRGLMRRFNKNSVEGSGGKKMAARPVVYNTYQMYLKHSPGNLAADLATAGREGWVLGVKLVRGAYLGSDPRELICESKEDTDAQFDEAVRGLFLGEGGGEKEAKEAKVALVVACHNRESIRKAREVAREAAQRRGQGRVVDVVYSQLMGMADEVSFGLVEEGRRSVVGEETKSEMETDTPKVYKYVVWGSVSECLKYLLRRAEENKDAVGRSRENVRACLEEVRWRVGLRG
ncbi:FAD-linked oxidoreductase-like protein [Peziza echinospora]|nr:FAD-linked oxidoreductase-like protein [Peziza echinospora]